MEQQIEGQYETTKRKIKWIYQTKNFGLSKDQETEQCESAESVKVETEKRLQKLSVDGAEVIALIKEREKYLNFQKAIDETFERHNKIEIEIFYKDREYQQKKRVSELLTRMDRLVDELEIKLDCPAQIPTNVQRILTLHGEKRKTVNICLFVADPLVYKQDRKIYAVQKEVSDSSVVWKIIEDNFKCHLDVNVSLYYLGIDFKGAIKEIKQNCESLDAVVVHVMTSVFEESGELYFMTEDENKIGMRDKMKCIDFFHELKLINNLYCVMLSGENIHYLQKQQVKLESELNAPIFGIDTFGINHDQNAKQFLKDFYSDIFLRKPMYDWKHKWSKQQFVCCCVQKHSNEVWRNLVRMVGCSTLHQLFAHTSALEINKNRNKFIVFTHLLKGTQNQLECSGSKALSQHNLNLQDYSLRITKQQCGLINLNYPQKIKSNQGNLTKNFGAFNSFVHVRLKTAYEIIQSIHNPKILFVIVNGESRSGKHNIIRFVEKYLKDRYSQQRNKKGHIKNMVKFINLADQFENDNQKQFLRILKQKLRIGNRYIIQLNHLTPDRAKKLQSYIENIDIKLNVCFLLVSHQEINLNKSKIVNMEKLTREQIIYIIYRELAKIESKSGEKNFIKNKIPLLQALTKHNIEDLKKIPYLDLDQFITTRLASKIPFDPEKIKSDIEKFSQRTHNDLDKVFKEQPKMWNLLGMISLFVEGFYLSKINLGILQKIFEIGSGLNKKIIEYSSDAQTSLQKFKIPRYNIYADDSFSSKLDFQRRFSEQKQQNDKWKHLIIPENMMVKYYASMDEQMIMKLKKYQIRYFELYFYSIVNKYLRKTMDEDGIFIFGCNFPELQADLAEKKIMRVDTQLNLINEEMKNLIYNHEKLFAIMLKKIADPQNKKETNKLLADPEVTKQLLISIFYFLKYRPPGFKMLDLSFTNSEINDRISEVLQKICIDDLKLKVTKIQCQKILNDLKYLKQSNFQNTIVERMVEYERKMIEISQLKAKLLTLKKTDKVAIEIIQLIGKAIDKAICILEEVKSESERKKEEIIYLTDNEDINPQLQEMIIKLIIKKILLRFQENIDTSPDHRHHYFSTEKLRKSLTEKKNEIQNNSWKISQQLSNFMKVCLIYLEDTNKELIDFSNPPKKSQELNFYQHVMYKINPKSLLEKQNILLFMKSRCFRIRGKEICFVRKDNMIKNFLERRLKDKAVNLFFLNLSTKKLDMIKGNKNWIPYIFLSIDCIAEGDSLKLVFEHPSKAEEDIRNSDEFINVLKQINFTFLILMGSNTDRLAKKIYEKIGNSIHIIAFYLEKQFTLSSYPDAEDMNIPEVTSTFIKNENTHRAMELITCSLSTLLVRQKYHITIKKLEEIVCKSKNYADQIIRQWYGNSQACKYSEFKFQIFSSTLPFICSIFPLINEGKLTDLTSALNIIPKNFSDDSHYEMVGRIQELSEVINLLSERADKQKKTWLIQITGEQKSGKTEFLKEIGWFCQTRSIFELGVYYFDMNQIRRNNTSILEYLHCIKKQQRLITNMEQSHNQKNHILLLLDNLQAEDLEIDNFNFFQKISRDSISVVYSSKQTLSQYFEKIVEKPVQKSNEMFLYKKKSLQKKQRKWEWFSKDITKISELEQACIVLTKIRNPKQNYTQALKSIIKHIQLQHKQKEVKLKSTLKKIQEYKKKSQYNQKYQSYLKFDIEKLMSKTNTIQKITIKIRR